MRLVAGTTAPSGTIALSSTGPVVGQQLTVYNSTLIPATLSGQTLPANLASSLVYSNGGWQVTGASTGDNLGNHVATLDLNLQDNALTGNGANLGPTVGVGVTAKGGLNIAQNVPGLNLLIGYRAGFFTTYGTSPVRSGYNNHFVGYQAGYNNSSASNNQFEGYQAGYLNTTGHGNLAVGNSALYTNQQNSYNTAIGDSALVRATGNQPSTTYSANFNTAVGFQAGYNNTGSRNTFIGYKAGYYTTGGNSGAPTAGNNNVALGWQAGVPTGMGNLTNTIAIGSMAVVTQSNSMALGGDGSTSRPAVNVGIGTSAPAYPLDVNGVARVGTGSTPGTIYSPSTATHNLLAIAYGRLDGLASTNYNTSGNYTFARTGPGTYTITFPSTTSLNNYYFGYAAVTASLYNAVGFISWTGDYGLINVKTYNSSGVAADQVFSFTAFQP